VLKNRAARPHNHQSITRRLPVCAYIGRKRAAHS
jgi:hypothetical protein